MTDEQRKAIGDRICEIMREHGPDHIDGHDQLTDYVLGLIAAERERCAGIVDAIIRELDEQCDTGCTEDAAISVHDDPIKAARYIAARIRSGE